jgi:uncharacterized membrane protein
VTTTPDRARVWSLDVIRGAVMVLMAIDHVRVYSGVPAGGPTIGIFATRWITHFCAPAFVFLAGTGAYLYWRRCGSRGALAQYLLTRGLVLVALEVTVIHAAWTFTGDMRMLLAGVIWMLGWCMVLLAGMVWLPTWAIATLGMALIVGQDGVGALLRALPSSALWQFLYLGGDVVVFDGAVTISILYVIVPWVGVMAVGYAFGALVVGEARERQRWSIRLGVAATALFLVLGGVTTLMAQTSESAPPLLVQFLNQRKYPASPLFLLMTLGPTLALLPLAERAHGWIGRALVTFGRVPLFYYLLHIPLIHAVALLVWRLRDGQAGAGRFTSAPYVSIPDAERWSLPLLYLVFAIVIAVLYPLCRWFAGVKARGRWRWLRYI